MMRPQIEEQIRKYFDEQNIRGFFGFYLIQINGSLWSGSGSLAKFAAIRRASPPVIHF